MRYKIFLMLLLVIPCVNAKYRKNEFVVDDAAKAGSALKSNKYRKQKRQDLVEEIVFTTVHSLEALHEHIAQESCLGQKANHESIQMLCGLAQQVLSFSRQVIEGEKNCFMADATVQSLGTVLQTLQEIQRTIGHPIDRAWIVAQQKSIKKNCW